MINIAGRPFTVLFAGHGIIRKGLQLLLKYWHVSQINGVLRMVGKIDDSINDLIKPYKENSNIEFVSFTEDIGQKFLNADVFAIPSLEEGSPLVTSLALGARLPVIASPMRAGGVVREQVDGFKVDQRDRDMGVESLRLLEKDTLIRNRLAKSVAIHSEQYLWSNVGKQRAKSMLSAICSIK